LIPVVLTCHLLPLRILTAFSAVHPADWHKIASAEFLTIRCLHDENFSPPPPVQ
jgi:hypothetical protein